MYLLKFLLLILIKASLQASTPLSATYEAGVVEIHFGNRANKSSNEILNEQLDLYLNIMENAPSNLDIIVFPESTLNSMATASEIPEPEDNISPCDDDKYKVEDLIKQISCSANKHKRYVVINITTKTKCPDADMIANKDPRKCEAREDGLSYYNTNVVFDRNGTVISRYRKFNLFGEKVDKPYKPSMVTFDTDFGVKFGHFICFDLMFRYPAVDLVRNHNVTDIIFPTMWFSELPYLSAVQVQQNWAFSNNVNFLAAGANNVAIGSTGSGIYGGKKGAYVADMAATSKSHLYTATVYKIKNFQQNDNIIIQHDVKKYTKDEMKNLYLKRDQLDVYQFKFLNDSNGDHSYDEKLCESETCCNIKVNYTVTYSDRIPHYQYTLAFYHGKRTFDGFANGGSVVCTILACQSTNISTCGVRNEELDSIHIWSSIEIDAELPTKDDQFLYLPTSLDTSILPLQPEFFEYETKETAASDTIKITMKLNSHADSLITFGIYGRDFNLDENSGSIHKISIILMLILLLFAFLTVSI
ncbi:hypothetical protein PVAND_002573 [Polypedilum vanderplanki]|uniref:CN hydrolase domain-containing protein n=1 Tax=Polypedilum vanderplanki TaxID=319348 RepID=A0A9J6BS46_POLVA|nr:hypothetical protein PVAND_002573 [Polypedilum vanderplanki]